MEMTEPEIGIVYLIQPQEYVNKLNWYKIGRTGDFIERMSGYGKFTKVISVKTIQNPSEVENILRVTFRYFFKLVRGNEYFEGDIQRMYQKFEELTAQRLYIPKFLAAPAMVEVSPLPIDPAIIEAKAGTAEVPETPVLSNDLPPVAPYQGIPSIDKPTPKNPFGRQCPRCGSIFADKYGMKTHFKKQIAGCFTPEKKHVKISDHYQKNVVQSEASSKTATSSESDSSLSVPKAT